ncbi:poly [ADP-ribose] polymerase [Elysia marginata]|uniref:Poly [ADP-ribose] polymerase n=1 Tax=Elysia marginata TaxID=1093978 RepID=A0AAV4JN38_9GAST|nr:poly [ADP-ribose] polymerase [Elysia marginata]
MPPKRKAQTAAAASKAKKGKVEAAPAEPETMKDKIAKLKAADAGKVKKSKPDTYCPISSSSEGEPGQNALKGPFGTDAAAVKDFEKKFKDKTKNNWSDRANFKAVAGKYTLLDMAGDDDGEDDVDYSALDAADGVPKKVAPCSLDKSTQDLINLIFDTDMFKAALKKFDLDTKKMPLGKLSKTQIAKGERSLAGTELLLS